MMLTGYYIKVTQVPDPDAPWRYMDDYNVDKFEVDSEAFLAKAQEIVGGFIEAIPTADSISIFVNEDGKGNRLPHNQLADALWWRFDKYSCIPNGDWIAGNVVIMGPTTRGGRTTSAPENTIELIQSILGLAVD